MIKFHLIKKDIKCFRKPWSSFISVSFNQNSIKLVGCPRRYEINYLHSKCYSSTQKKFLPGTRHLSFSVTVLWDGIISFQTLTVNSNHNIDKKFLHFSNVRIWSHFYFHTTLGLFNLAQVTLILIIIDLY